MTLPTHLAFASVLYLGGATLFGYRPDGIGWLLAAVASLLPDIDLPPARIGRLFWFVSVPLERRFGHRTLTHSAVMLLAVAALAAPLWFLNPLYFWAVVGGYWSHLWLDMLNVRGIDLFWPSPVRLVTPGNRHWRFQVGGRGEMILLAGLIGLTVALYPLSHLGFRDGLQALLKNFDIAREQYQRVAGTHWYDLELTATDHLTLQPVQGRFPVVGVWQNGLIVAQDGTLRAVGPSPTHHNLYPLQARLIQGEPLRVVAERVTMSGHSLRWLVSRIDQSRPYYLLGEVEIPDGRGPAITGRLDSVDTYNPASYRGGILRLHYARAQELEPWLDLVAVRGEVVVQFWLAGGGRRAAGGADSGAVEEVFVRGRPGRIAGKTFNF